MHKIKETITLKRPAYISFCILDLSKVLMYDFHYSYIKKQYGSDAKLLFTDTDSLTYKVKTNDIYKDFYKNQEMFDNSNYQESSPFHYKDSMKEKWRIRLLAYQ